MTASETSPSDDVVLTARRDAGAGMYLVTLRPAAERVADYRAIGQYIDVHAQGVAGFFVMAGAPGARDWEVLVRNVGGAAEALATAPLGSRFLVSGPIGTGFPVARAEGRALVVLVVGSALAVARPLMAIRDPSLTHVYVGARSMADVPLLKEEVSGWRARVVFCLSRDARQAGENTRKGYVQHVFAEDLAAKRVPVGPVFAAGPAAMVEDVRALGANEPTLEVVPNA